MKEYCHYCRRPIDGGRVCESCRPAILGVKYRNAKELFAEYIKPPMFDPLEVVAATRAFRELTAFVEGKEAQ